MSARSRFLEPPRLRTLAGGEQDDRRATWLELFFDLVFVAAVGQLAAPAEAEPRDGGDQWRAQAAYGIPAIDAAFLVERDRTSSGQLGDVGAGGERALVPSEDDAADGLVRVQLLQRRHELLHQSARQSIQLLRPIQQDDRDRVVALYEDERLRNDFTASCASSPSIESASQSRAWFTVSCHERSRQKFSCCLA